MTTGNNKRTILCKGQIILLDEPRIMGILNITPDSFYDGGRNSDLKEIGVTVEKMLTDGATWIDIGAVSTRPKSDPADYETEKQRLEPVLKLISKNYPDALVSVDTFRSETAKMVVEKFGVCMINDISAGEMDKEMIKTVGKLNVPYIATHMKGTPKNMQSEKNTKYGDIINEIIQYLAQKKEILNRFGVTDVIADPGFGFSKTQTQNFTILKNLAKFRILDCPIIAGISRKSMIYKTIGCTPDEALSGTLSANTLALINGADILRVHDVKETADIIKIFKQYTQS